MLFGAAGSSALAEAGGSAEDLGGVPAGMRRVYDGISVCQRGFGGLMGEITLNISRVIGVVIPNIELHRVNSLITYYGL